MALDCTPLEQPFRCPTRYELFLELVGLLPHGRAWQTHDGVVPDEAATPDGDITVLQRYWMAFAAELEYLHARACVLINEFFCTTVTETRPEWDVEYGFPDPCESYADLCAKVTAVGGTTCDYFASVAAARGWALRCREPEPQMRAGCGWRADCGGRADQGTMLPTLIFEIDRAASAAFTGNPVMRADMGRDLPEDCAETTVTAMLPEMLPFTLGAAELSPTYCGPAPRADGGWMPECLPAPEALVCLIDRIKPAHVPALYIIV